MLLNSKFRHSARYPKEGAIDETYPIHVTTGPSDFHRPGHGGQARHDGAVVPRLLRIGRPSRRSPPGSSSKQ